MRPWRPVLRTTVGHARDSGSWETRSGPVAVPLSVLHTLRLYTSLRPDGAPGVVSAVLGGAALRPAGASAAGGIPGGVEHLPDVFPGAAPRWLPLRPRHKPVPERAAT